MDSHREPLPPIVDERLIEAPFEVAVLGQTYVEAVASEPTNSVSRSREARREERRALKLARREAKLQTTAESKRTKEQSRNSVDAQLSVAVSEPTLKGSAPVRPSRSFSFDDLIDGPAE